MLLQCKKTNLAIFGGRFTTKNHPKNDKNKFYLKMIVIQCCIDQYQKVVLHSLYLKSFQNVAKGHMVMNAMNHAETVIT